VAAVLSEFLGELARRRFDWVTCNCFTICADWVLRAHGRDPAAPWRDRFQTRDDALAFLRDAGGAVAFADRAMQDIGAVPTLQVRAGDVAMVSMPIARLDGDIIRRPTAAICVDAKAFASLTLRDGLVIQPLPLIQGWHIHVE
jgi:hypothetical protein